MFATLLICVQQNVYLIDISAILAQKSQVLLPVCKSNFHQLAHSIPLQRKTGSSEAKISILISPQSRS